VTVCAYIDTIRSTTDLYGIVHVYPY